VNKNRELDKIIKHKNIINFIRAQRLGWLGHIERMQETRMVNLIFFFIPLLTGVLCSRLQTAMIPDAENTICRPEDGHVNARNMSRIVV
jgi:hypothetical protein